MSVEKVAGDVRRHREGMRSVSGSRVDELYYMCAIHEGRRVERVPQGGVARRVLTAEDTQSNGVTALEREHEGSIVLS